MWKAGNIPTAQSSSISLSSSRPAIRYRRKYSKEKWVIKVSVERVSGVGLAMEKQSKIVNTKMILQVYEGEMKVFFPKREIIFYK